CPSKTLWTRNDLEANHVNDLYTTRVTENTITAYIMGMSSWNIGSPAAEPNPKIIATSNKDNCRTPRFPDKRNTNKIIRNMTTVRPMISPINCHSTPLIKKFPTREHVINLHSVPDLRGCRLLGCNNCSLHLPNLFPPVHRPIQHLGYPNHHPRRKTYSLGFALPAHLLFFSLVRKYPLVHHNADSQENLPDCLVYFSLNLA